MMTSVREWQPTYTSIAQDWSVPPPTQDPEIMVWGCLGGSELLESCIELFPATLYAQNRSPIPFWSSAIGTCSNILVRGGTLQS